MISLNAGRLVAFVKAGEDHGTILGVSGIFAEERAHTGTDIVDHNMPIPSVTGLAVFEGNLHVGSGDDPDVCLVGQWRQATHWEVCRLRVGLMPWDEDGI